MFSQILSPIMIIRTLNLYNSGTLQTQNHYNSVASLVKLIIVIFVLGLLQFAVYFR